MDSKTTTANPTPRVANSSRLVSRRLVIDATLMQIAIDRIELANTNLNGTHHYVSTAAAFNACAGFTPMPLGSTLVTVGATMPDTETVHRFSTPITFHRGL